MITTRVRSDEGGLFVVHKGWVARPQWPTTLSEGDTITPKWPGGLFIVLGFTGEEFATKRKEMWKIECSQWWHKTASKDRSDSAERRERDRLRGIMDLTPGNPAPIKRPDDFLDEDRRHHFPG